MAYIRLTRIVVLALASLSVAATQVTPLQTRSLPAAGLAELDEFVRTRQTAAKIPGLSVAIGFHGQVIYSKGFGAADLENSVQVTPNTAFRTASLAKPMTATAVMTLVEAGKLDLDAPIQQYCPAFPKKPWPITARLILGHLAGIRHYKPRESSGTTHYFTIESSLDIFKNDPLEHEPGTKYLYSTFGYSVLGCAIEGASKTTYETYMRDHVWTPAAMARTRLDRLWDIVPDRARGYELLTEATYKTLPDAARLIAKPDTIYNASLHDTSMKVPGGGILSTAEDLVRFATAVMTASLVKKASVEMMWTEGHTKSGEATGYGLGWGIGAPQEGIRRLSHGGNQTGASSAIVVLPEIELSYALMSNLEDVDWPPITRGIAQILRKYLMQ